jgi:hypothetical protein
MMMVILRIIEELIDFLYSGQSLRSTNTGDVR